MNYSKILNLLDGLQKLASISEEHLILAEETNDPELLEVVAETEVLVAELYKTAAEKVQAKLAAVPTLDAQEIAEIAALATEFDASGDEMLIRQAAVLDRILVLAAGTSDDREAWRHEDILRVRSVQPEEKAKEIHKDEMEKAVKEAETVKEAKEFRMMEAPLSTHTCPDHPGAQLGRIADGVYQCAMDKQVYNYRTGFKTMKGNIIPGGDVANQTQALYNLPQEHMSFDTRDTKLHY
jgi:hypothetical protein